ncbi:hypothetical protein CEE45_06910 [Candidatus Heimdallarchaeota archaeon B3_Heim]|nr:MAG: hypothetical protein CEE45_06910 [Candidatus Heimdallarchaeota archaeon B3_Heim]
MESQINKNFSPRSSCTTWQELQLKQLMHSENIPFEFQKIFSLPDRHYIVDFFLPQQTILECSFSSMEKYYVAFRNKAVSLEAKSLQLKKHYSSLTMWVLFETHSPILEPLTYTLIRLMPSVDHIFFSQQALCEHLQRYFSLAAKTEEVIR